MLKILFILVLMLLSIWSIDYIWTPSPIRLAFWFLCTIYFICIAPFVYRWWIIPNIEKRYGKKLIFNYPSYKLDFLPPIHLEVSGHIVFALFGYTIRNRCEALSKINYNIKTAPKAEIIVSIITFCSMLFALLTPLFDYLYYR